MSLVTKYRPADFDDMLGNRYVIEAVESLVGRDFEDVPRAWLFVGNSGCGKTTIARIIAKKLGARDSGIYEVNAGDVRGIESMREIIKGCRYKPVVGNVSVYILDEAHQLTKDAQNAILKILEDAPKHAIFILCTTDEEKILGTVRTRCSEFRFDPLEEKDIRVLLVNVSLMEGMSIGDLVISEIEKRCAGSPRLALNMLERCSDVGDDLEKARKLVSGMCMDFDREGEFIISGRIFDVLLDNRTKVHKWKVIAEIVEKDVLDTGVDFADVQRGLEARMGRYLLKKGSLVMAESLMMLSSSKVRSVGGFISLLYSVLDRMARAGSVSGSVGVSGGPR